MKFNNKSKAFIALMILFISLVSVGAAFAADADVDDASLAESADAVALEDSADIEEQTSSSSEDAVLSDPTYGDSSDKKGIDIDNTTIEMTEGKSVNLNGKVYDDDGEAYDTIDLTLIARYAGDDNNNLYLENDYCNEGKKPVQITETVNGEAASTSPWTIGNTGYETLEAAVTAANNSADSVIEIIGEPGTYDLNSKINIKAGKVITIKSASETEAVVLKPVKFSSGYVFTIAKGADLTLHNIVFTDFLNVLLYNSGNVSVDNCTIMNGNKTAAGVALTNMGNATFNNTKISNNNVTTLIANMLNGNLTINNSAIDNHYLIGTTSYAPINNNGANMIVANTNISNSNGTAAGAIYNQGTKPTLVIENCHFENLTAKSATGRSVSAGAISNTVTTGIVNITGSTFKNITGANGTLYLNTTNKEVSGNTFEDCTIFYNITSEQSEIFAGQATTISLVLRDPDTYGDSTISNPAFNVFVKYAENEYENIGESTATTYTFVPENTGSCSVYLTINDIATNTLTFDVIALPTPWTIGNTGYETLEEAVAAANNNADSVIEIIGEPGTYDLNSKINIKAGKVITIKSASETEAVVIKPVKFSSGNVFTIAKGADLTLHNIIFTNFLNVLLYNSGNVSVDNCTIMNGNKTTTGVALTNMGNATFNNTKISNNNVTTLIVNSVNSNLTINNSVIDNNRLSGTTGYAPIVNTGGNLTVDSTTISNCNGSTAGAIYNNQYQLGSYGSPTNGTSYVSNCNFENLTAKGALATSKTAGAINSVKNSAITISGSTFKNVTGTNGTLYLETANKEVSGNTFEDCTIFYNITAEQSEIYAGKATTISLVLRDPDTYGDSTISNPTFNVFVKYAENEYENIGESTATTYTFVPENTGSCSVYLTINDIATNTLTFNVDNFNPWTIGSIDVLNGTDAYLTISYSSLEGAVANAALNLTLSETYGNVISKIITTDDNGVARYNVAGLSSGIYSTSIYLVEDAANTASAECNVKIKFSDDSDSRFVIVNPAEISMTEGKSAIVNVSLVDNYNQKDNTMDCLNVSFGEKAIHIDLENENSALVDLKDLELVESETPYEVSFEFYKTDGKSYSTTENVTVLLNTDIFIIASDIHTTDTEVLNITVPKREAGVKLIITGKDYGLVEELTENGPFTYELKNLNAGEYGVTVIYSGEMTLTANTTFTVIGSDISFTADANASEIKYGESVKITLAGLPENADTSAITVTDNGAIIDVEIIDGAFAYTPKTSGEHNLTVSFTGDAKYNAFEAKTSVTLSSEGTIAIEPGDNPGEAIANAIAQAKAGDTIFLGDNNVYDNLSSIALKDGVSIVGGENTVVKAAEGASSVFVADANASSIILKNLVFNADANNTSLIAVTPESLDGGILQVPETDISGITVNVADGVEAESISILNFNTEDALKPSNSISVYRNLLNTGVNTVKTNSTSYSGNVEIPKAVATALAGADSQKVYAIPYAAAKSGKYYAVTLKDASGKTLSNKTVTFTFNGKTYNVKTDANGVAKLALNVYKPGTYAITAAFAGEDALGTSLKEASVKILKNKVKITRNTKKVKKSSKKRTIKFTLKTTTGKKIGIKGVKLTLKINKKTYTAKTNKKGLAKFKVKLPKVKKTYKVKVKFAGNKANAKKTLSTKVKVY